MIILAVVIGFVLSQRADDALLFSDRLFQFVIEPHELGSIALLKRPPLRLRESGQLCENRQHLV